MKNDDENAVVFDKPALTQRLIAYVIDILLVSFAASLISYPFVDHQKTDQLNDEYSAIISKVSNQEISIQEYSTDLINIEYAMAQNTGLTRIAAILLGVIYFVVFQVYHNGQTFGKKLMRIKVISSDGELTINQMIFRSFIANSLLLDILSIMFLIFASRSNYCYCVGLFSIIQYVIMIVSFCMVIGNKEGLTIHDRLVHTKVVKCD